MTENVSHGMCGESVAFFLLTLLIFLLASSSAFAEGVATFSWQANANGSDVVGYRLYYGRQSRFAVGHYDAYLDFTTWERCQVVPDGTKCVPLGGDEVSCQGLYGEKPVCQVGNLHGQMYFAITAYSSVSESGYSRELSKSVSPQAKPATLAVLQQVYSLLLHKKISTTRGISFNGSVPGDILIHCIDKITQMR